MENIRKPISAIADATIGQTADTGAPKPLSAIGDKFLPPPVKPSQGLMYGIPEEDAPPVERDSGFSSGFKSALQNQPDMYAQGLQAYGDLSGIDTLNSLGQKIISANAGKKVETMTWGDIENPGDVVDWFAERAGEGAGSMVTSMAAGLAGAGAGAGIGFAVAGPPGAAAGAGAGGIVGSAADSLTANIGELRQALISEGVDEQTASKYAVPFGSILSIPDVAVMGKVLSKFGIGSAAKDEARSKVIQHIRNEIAAGQYKSAGKQLIRQTGRDIADIAPIEAGTEFGQTLGQQGVVSGVAGKDFFSPENTEEALSATVSGLFGGAFGGAGGASVQTAFTTPDAKTRVPPPLTSGQTSQDGADVPPAPAAPTPSLPNRDTLASAMETPTAQQTPPPVTAVQPNSNPLASPPAAPIKAGDKVEHVTSFGEVIEGTIDSVQETPEQGLSYQIVDNLGEVHTVFDGDGTTNVVVAAPVQAPRIPTRDDLAAKMDGTYVEPTPAPAPVPNVSQPVQEIVPPAAPIEPPAIPKTFKEQLADMPDEELLTHYRGKNVRNRDLAAKELEDRYPGFDLTKKLDIAEQAERVNPEPTEAQKEAGNYRKGHISMNGLNITLENFKGGKRTGKDANGTAWEVEMPAHYGYIKRTTGADNEQLDVYVGDDTQADKIYMVDQIDADTQAFDEHKAMMGFSNIQDAMTAYEQAFSDGKADRRVGGVTIMSVDEFKTWLKEGKTKKPLQYVQPPAGEDFAPKSTPEVDIPFDSSPTDTPQRENPVQNVPEQGELVPQNTAPAQPEAKPAPAPRPKAPETPPAPDLFNQPEQPQAEAPKPKPLKPMLPPPEQRTNPNLMTEEEGMVADQGKWQRIIDGFKEAGDEQGATWATAVLNRVREWQSSSRQATDNLKDQVGAARYDAMTGEDRGNVIVVMNHWQKLVTEGQDGVAGPIMEAFSTAQDVADMGNTALSDELFNAALSLSKTYSEQVMAGKKPSGPVQTKASRLKALIEKANDFIDGKTPGTPAEPSAENTEEKQDVNLDPKPQESAVSELALIEDAPAALDDPATILEKAKKTRIEVINKLAEQEAENMAVDDRLLEKKRQLDKLIASLEKDLSPETSEPTHNFKVGDVVQYGGGDFKVTAVDGDRISVDDGAGMKASVSPTDIKPKPRPAKMQDVGEKMEGKRAFQDRMEKAKPSEKAKEIIDSTKKATLFQISKRDDQTEGVARFAQALVDGIYDFSAYLKNKSAIETSGRGKWSTKYYGWEKQLHNLFNAEEGDKVEIGERATVDGRIAEMRRKRVLEGADYYLNVAEKINDVFATSGNVQEFKVALKKALEDKDFEAELKAVAKSYSFIYEIFHDSPYGTFGKITDETLVKKPKRVENTLTRPKLEIIAREGLKDYRNGRDVTAEEFREAFGFRGVEFGEWVNAKEGQQHVNHAFDALHDMAARLGIKPTHISLGGKLGFAFGSRGSGEHAAHYEPGTNVINLTKTKGDGSVAHEWLHALDHNLRNSGGNVIMNEAYRSLEVTMLGADHIEKTVKEFLASKMWYEGRKKEGPIASARQYLTFVARDPVKQLRVTTNFKKEADDLGKNYWGTGKELLARAWEAFIHDTLDGHSPYLVSEWVADGAVTKETGYRGTPYPTGDERVAFNSFFEEFVKLIEFSDEGVKFKDGAQLPLQKQAAAAIEIAQSFQPKLADMMKEVTDGSVQQNGVSPSVSESDVGTGADNVSGAVEDGNSPSEPERDSGRGGSPLSGDGEASDGEGRDGGGSQERGDRDSVRGTDTVPEELDDAIPSFQAQGVNHVIPLGALDEKRGQKQKAKDNLEIIALVKKIETEARAATPEEQTLLAKYTGWGSIKNSFPNAEGKANEGWADIVSQVKEALTDKEYSEARRTIQYAHYTSEIVVRSMWDAMSRFGIKQGSVFEPGMGIGNFAGMMPAGLNIQYSGLEFDSMSARIARILYPQSSVRHADFVSARYADNMFDAAIGNPPFSNTTISGDPKYRKDKLSMHNYFFAKSIDMVAPGGIVAFVTSRFSMDAQDSAARAMMAEKVDLVGAIRLPDTAFKTNAHTDVVTDIIFLRKRLAGEESNGVKWMETKTIDVMTDKGMQEFHVNEYFHNNPEMVLGNYAQGSMYSGESLTVEPVQNAALTQQLEEAIGRLPENIATDIQKSNTEAMDMQPPESKEGSYYVKDGVLMQVDGGMGIAVPMRGKGVTGGISKGDADKITALIPIRNALRETMAAMVARDEGAMKTAQKALKKAHSAFTKKYGPVTKSETESRPPTPAQLEEARDELRNDYEAADMDFDEGDIDLSRLLGRINPETNKKFTPTQIGRIRQQRKEEIEAAGGMVSEGSFDPTTVPDNVTVKYPNLDAFKGDPEYYNLMILENYNQDTGEATTTEVFERNIVAEIKTPEIKTAVDALNYSLATTNGIDMNLMSKTLNKPAETIVEELEELDLIYSLPDPEGGERYAYSEEYLSGYVKDKLEYAKRIAKQNKKYERNVRALEAVQPVDIPASEINTRLGSPYFNTTVIQDFMREELKISASVTYTPILNAWEVSPHDRYAPENTTLFGTPDKPASELMASLLSKKDIRVTRLNAEDKPVVDVAATQAAQDKAKELQEKFSNWIWKSSHSERVFRDYNDQFNNIVPRKFDGSHITTAISPEIKLRPHQKNAVWRILQTGNTYLAHAVGAGKTLEMACAAMEMRRFGLWRKPMIVVPNHMLAQFAGEFRAAYPQAKIFVADEHNFHTDRRRRFVANVAKGDWDCVIITFSAFKKIPISANFEREMVETELGRYRAALTEAGGKKAVTTAAKLEKQIEKMENRLKALNVKDVDQSFSFEELGVDAIEIDEGHNFRKLSFATMQGTMKGVNPVGSKGSWDLYIKSKYLDTVHPGRSLVIASGTPLTNTLAEVFTIQRYMNERALEKRGINNFDAWSAVYANSVSNPERQPSGAYKVVTRLAEFMNLRSLSQMVREFMDTVTSDELGALVDRPTLKTGSMIIRTVKPTREYLAFQKYLAHRTEEVAKNSKKNEKGADNILAIIGEGRHAAIDMRLIDPTLPETDSKLEDMIERITTIYAETSEDTFRKKYRGDDAISPVKGGTQLVFSDLGVRQRTKDGKTFSAYDHIKRKLIKNGIPAAHIAFISDYDTTEEKRRLQKMVNDGEVRILVGSTARMGTGLNVQNRLKAIHNLDAPWLPADLEQRVGRGLRQGNQYGEIEVYGYGTEGSYDSTMWGMLETKAKAIIQFLKGDSDLSSMRDIEETDHFRMAKAMTSGDPRVLKQAELQSEVEKLARQAKNFRDEQVRIRSDIASMKNSTERYTQKIIDLKAALEKRKEPAEGEFLMTVLGKPYNVRAEASEALAKAVSSTIGSGVDTPAGGIKIGELQGFNVNMFVSNNSNLGYNYNLFLNDPALIEDGKEWESGGQGFSASGAITTLTNALDRIEKRIGTAERTIESNEREVKVLESQRAENFPKEAELKDKRDQLTAIDKDLHENAPVEVVYDDYPIEYWTRNKDAMNTMFSIASNEEFYYRPTSGRATLKLKQPREKIEAKLNDHLRKIGFPAANVVVYDPAVDMPNIIGMDARVQGAHSNGIVYISMNAADVIGTLNHEVVHALKAAGAFTEGEWKKLTFYAKPWRKKYDIDSRYGRLNLTEAQLNEEAVAHAMQNRAEKGVVERIRNRILRFFREIRSFFTGKPYEFETIDQIFDAIQSGEITKRVEKVLEKKKDNKIGPYKMDKKTLDRLAKFPMEMAPEGLDDEPRIMYALPDNKKEALAAAQEVLDRIDGANNEFRPSMNKVAALTLHPFHIASIYKSFTPVFTLAIDMLKMRDVVVHELSDHLSVYNKIDAKAKKKIDAVLEIGRLTKQNFTVGKDGNITVKNTAIDSARHSAVGEEIVLTGPEVSGYLGVRMAMDRALDTYKQTILQEYGFLEEGIESQSALAKAIGKEQDKQKIAHMQEALRMLQDIEDAKRHGYIPFKRWGEVGITIRKKAEDGGEAELVWFERVELPKRKKKTIGENKAVRDRLLELAEKYPDSEFEIETFEVKDFTTLQSKLTLNELDVLAASSDMSEQDYSVMRSMLEDAIKRRGFRSHFFKSKDVPGYSDDFERAINDYVVSIAGHLSRRVYIPKLDKAISKIEKAGETTLFDYARKYVAYITDPQEEFGAVRQMAFVWYLAGNLASGITNSLQPMMVTAPWFKAMFSHAKVAKQMTAAYADASKMLSVTQGTGMFDFDKAPNDVRGALKKANAEGEFIPLNTFESMAIATTNAAYLRGVDRQMRVVQDVLSLTFSVPERTNRLVTYISAYRFAKDPENKKKIMSFVGRDQIARQTLVGKSGNEFAEAFADYAVISTQFRMGKLNRPTMARGLGTLFFQFMGYVMQSFELMYRLSRVNEKGATSVGIMLLAIVAMSGLFGFPFMDDLKKIFEAAWKKFARTDLDIESNMREFLTEHFGSMISDAVVKGVPYAAMNVDMSSRLGMGNVIPDGQADLLGVWFDMLVTNPSKALESAVKGDYMQAMAQISPAFLKNPIQGMLWSEGGVRSGTTGAPIIPKEDLTGFDIGAKLFGFTSADVSRERGRVWAVQRAERAADDLRNDYYNRITKTIVAMNSVYNTDKEAAAGYDAELQSIFAEIERHNANTPLHKNVIINRRVLKDRVRKETEGASAKRLRKQARGQAEALDKAYGKD